jgi:hypothetical protein
MHVKAGFQLGNIANPTVTNMSMSMDGKAAFGGQAAFDYVFNFGLSVGGEVGVLSAKAESGTFKDTFTAIPILARVGYHLSALGFLPKNMDLYFLGKMGFVPGVWSGDSKDYLDELLEMYGGSSIDNPKGFGFGFDVGYAFYFTPIVGIFAEAGFERYLLKSEVSVEGSTYEAESPMNKFFTLGLALKF